MSQQKDDIQKKFDGFGSQVRDFENKIKELED
jgi:hypothetical protein